MINNKHAIIAGYAAIFNNIDKNSHVILSGALELPFEIPILFQHKHNQILGRVLYSKFDPKGLYIEAVLLLNTSLQREVFDLIKNNNVYGMSVGLKVEKSKMEMGILRIKKAQLIEISLTTNPINPHCKIDFCEEF
jgi:HK97 family phage prohead protease